MENNEYEHFYLEKTDNSIHKLNNKHHLGVEGGINLTCFQEVNSERRFGYSIGLTYFYNFTDYFGIDISGLISRQNILLRKRESTGTDGLFVYRILYDHQISILFFELPIMLKIKLWDNNFMSIYSGFGIGYSVSFKDNSRRTNFIDTGEILDLPIPTDEFYIEDSVFDNSGKNLNAATWFSWKKFIFKLLYVNKRYDIKRIDKAHTVLLHFGYYFN